MFFCKECGYESTKWSGKCPACGEWDSFRESARFTTKKGGLKPAAQEAKAVRLKDAEVEGETERISTKISELDGVLGGGIIPGMVILLGGEPGIGKSTLMLQMADKVAESRPVLYVSGEESKQQIALRSKRLNCRTDHLYLLCTTDANNILQESNKIKPGLLIVDSIQSIFSADSQSSLGSITQIRETTAFFTKLAKQQDIPIILIGHVTKEGSVAGPKIIEHMVDTVLYFEKEMHHYYKILRTTKNRFGSTNEIGIFEMQKNGLVEVPNPSHIFLEGIRDKAGSAVGCVLEGSRAFLVEVQALITSASYGTSQRVTVGYDYKKLALLIAVLEKHLELMICQEDIFVHLVGGIKVWEPALDLSVIAALLSSFRNKPLPPKSVFIGEVSLNGDIRHVSQLEQRIKEAEKLGYTNIFIPHGMKNKYPSCTTVKTVNDFYELIL